MMKRSSSIHRQLIRSFSLFAGALVLITWNISMAYYFWAERVELVQSVQTDAAIISVQSTAAVVFGDTRVLTENLNSLRHIQSLRWALIIDSPRNAGAVAPSRWASHGDPPQDLGPILAQLDESGDVVSDLTDLVVRRRIMHDGVERGQLLIGIDQRDKLFEFGVICLASILLNLFFYVVAVAVVNRIVLGISGPIRELAVLSGKIAAEGSGAARARADGSDEVAQLAVALNHMLDTLSAHERGLAKSRDELRALSSHLAEVREEERKRISHEIHDELGQRLTAIKYELTRVDDRGVRSNLGSMVDGAIQVVRDISWELRPTLLDSMGLMAAIEWLAHDSSRLMGIRCRVHCPHELVDVDQDRATDLFRICQELLTNIARHARATRVDIRVSVTDASFILEVEDDGVGLPADVGQRGSLGLLGIRERCQRWNGRVEFSSGAQGKGTCVRVTLMRGLAHSVAEIPS